MHACSIPRLCTTSLSLSLGLKGMQLCMTNKFQIVTNWFFMNLETGKKRKFKLTKSTSTLRFYSNITSGPLLISLTILVRILFKELICLIGFILVETMNERQSLLTYHNHYGMIMYTCILSMNLKVWHAMRWTHKKSI